MDQLPVELFRVTVDAASLQAYLRSVQRAISELQVGCGTAESSHRAEPATGDDDSAGFGTEQ